MCMKSQNEREHTKEREMGQNGIFDQEVIPLSILILSHKFETTSKLKVTKRTCLNEAEQYYKNHNSCLPLPTKIYKSS